MNKPLHSFEEFTDYVYDVKWSPVHPAVFACADGSGRLSVWNINVESDVRRPYSVYGSNQTRYLWSPSMPAKVKR